MGFVDDLLTFLADQQVGEISLFKWYAPDTSGTSVTVTPTLGPTSDAKHAYDNPTFQIRVRGTDSTSVEAVADRVFVLLQSFHGGPLVPGGQHVVDIQGQPPAYIGRDAVGRDNLVMNFRARVQSPDPGNRE